jgi:hypothetical protein
MIETRRRAHRSRFSVSTTVFKEVSPCGGADRATTRSAGYKDSLRLTIRIHCLRKMSRPGPKKHLQSLFRLLAKE